MLVNDRRCGAFQLLDLLIEISVERILGNPCSVTLQLIFVDADKDGGDIVEQLVYPAEMQKRLINRLDSRNLVFWAFSEFPNETHHKNEPKLLCPPPFQCVFLLLECGRSAVGGGNFFLDENLVDQAVDDVGADGGVGPRPQHYAGGRNDFESVQHGLDRS